MDQRPGQNVDLGLYFHMEGPVSQKIKLKNRFMAEKNRIFQKICESSTKFMFANVTGFQPVFDNWFALWDLPKPGQQEPYQTAAQTGKINKKCPKTGQTKSKKLLKHIAEIGKLVVQMAYLSVPSPGKFIFDIFGKHIFQHFFDSP